MKKITIDFPQELQQQIKLLNSLYELTLKQKNLIENCDYENLFTTKSDFNEITKTIKLQREKLSYFEDSWDFHQSDISLNVLNNINELVQQINDLMKKVKKIENQNCIMLQKIGEKLIEFG